MIRKLRARHRAVILLLAPILPAILLVALLGRSRIPPTGLPRELAERRDSRLVPVGSDWTLLESPKIRARFLAQQGDSIPSAIVLDPIEQPMPPDLLVYWVEAAGGSTALPADAVLLGSLKADEELRLPASNRGYLIVYSLAHRQRIGLAQLPRIP